MLPIFSFINKHLEIVQEYFFYEGKMNFQIKGTQKATKVSLPQHCIFMLFKVSSYSIFTDLKLKGPQREATYCSLFVNNAFTIR